MFAMPHIETLRIRTLKPLHPGHQIGLRCLKQKVIVVAHQNVAVNNPPRLAAGLAQSLQEHLPICIVLNVLVKRKWDHRKTFESQIHLSGKKAQKL